MTADIHGLRDALTDEIIRAFGLPKSNKLHQIFGVVFKRTIERFSSGGAAFDEIVENDGFQKAAIWVLKEFCSSITSYGLDSVPLKGPLLVVANHPGTFDAFIIAAMLNRSDIKIISNDIVFLKYLPNTCANLIFGDRKNDIYKRVNAARAGIQHLEDGGALILFGTGLIDPDPEVYPLAEKDLETWSASIDLFLKEVPDTNVLVTIVSGVLSKGWGDHPITWLRRDARRKRLLAEIGQVTQQLLFPRSLFLAPHISFAPAVSATELKRESNSERVLPTIITRGKLLLSQHIGRISSGQGKGKEILELTAQFKNL